MADRELIIEYLLKTRDFYSEYHNRKERAAWSGLILYILFSGTVVQLSSSLGENTITKVIVTVFLVGTTVTVFLYIENQFDLKEEASAIVAVTNVLISKYAMMDESDINLDEFFSRDADHSTSMDTDAVLPNEINSRKATYKTDVLTSVRAVLRGDIENASSSNITRVSAYILLNLSMFSLLLYLWLQ